MTRFHLHLFGSFHAEIDGQAANGFRSDKVRALLAYLAVESDRVHRREALAALFWPESEGSAARASLRMSLSNLRQVLAPVLSEGNASPLLDITRHSAELRSQHPDFWLDVLRFDAWLEACEVHPHQDLTRCLACVQRLAQAQELYEGDFLAGLTLTDAPVFDEWRVLQQEKYHQRALAGLRTLAQHHLAGGDYERAQVYARRRLALAPWDEEAHRELMRALALDGQQAAALAQYEACRRALVDELGAEPTAETVALAEQIRAGEPAYGDEEKVAAPTAGVSTVAHNLPPQMTPFIGRLTEMTTVRRRLLDPGYRLVTLVGVGGVGKTRLALAVATQMQRHFPQGVWFVSLVGIEPPPPEAEDPAVVIEAALATAVASALNLTFAGEAEPAAQLLSYLRGKELLLLLDNFEHLLDGVGFLSQILRRAPTVTLLVTSRQRLNLQAEYAYGLQGLALPTSEWEEEHAVQTESVQLFVERAGRTPAGFSLTPSNLPYIVEICRLVDGLPLAIELAATWTAYHTLGEIVRAIRHNLDFLATEMRDVPARHRSLRAVFNRSWQLLSERERRVLALAAVFRGQFTREAATTVTGATLTELAGLVDKSLLRRSGDGWYDLHPLLRQYAAEKRDSFPAAIAEAEARHTHNYLRLVREQARALDTTEAPWVLRQLRRNLPDIRHAWRRAVASFDLALIDETVEALATFFVHAGLLQEGVETLDSALAELETAIAPVVRARLMNQRARFAYILADYDGGLATARAALELVAVSGPPAVVAHAHLEIGRALEGKCEYEAARAQLQQALVLAEANKLPNVHINSCRTLGHVYWFQGDYAAARHHYLAGLNAARAYNRRTGEIHMLNNLGNLSYSEGEFAIARGHYEQVIALAQELGNRLIESTAQGNLGRVLLDQGNYPAARETIREAMRHREEIGEGYGLTIMRNSLGDIALNCGSYKEARSLYLQCLAFHRQTGNRQAISHALANVALATYLLGAHEDAAAKAREALAVAQEVGAAVEQADALTRMGHALLALRREVEAVAVYEEALALRRELGQANRALEPLAGLARVALAQDRVQAALPYVNQIMDYLEGNDLTGVVQPFWIYLTCYRVLEAAGDSRAPTILEHAVEQLKERAGHIGAADVRRSYLNDVPAHRELLAALRTR